MAAIDILTEALAFILSIYMVWRLQIRVGAKLRVIAAFCCRLLYVSKGQSGRSLHLTAGRVIALCAVHLHVWISYTQGLPSSISIVPVMIWQQMLLTASLITGTIPNLKAFLQSLSADWGRSQFGYTRNAYGIETIRLNSIGSVDWERAEMGVKTKVKALSPAAVKNSDRTEGKSDGLIYKQTVVRMV